MPVHHKHRKIVPGSSCLAYYPSCIPAPSVLTFRFRSTLLLYCRPQNSTTLFLREWRRRCTHRYCGERVRPPGQIEGLPGVVARRSLATHLKLLFHFPSRRIWGLVDEFGEGGGGAIGRRRGRRVASPHTHPGPLLIGRSPQAAAGRMVRRQRYLWSPLTRCRHGKLDNAT